VEHCRPPRHHRPMTGSGCSLVGILRIERMGIPWRGQQAVLAGPIGVSRRVEVSRAVDILGFVRLAVMIRRLGDWASAEVWGRSARAVPWTRGWTP
jgi:hypothetical protein